MSFDLHFQLPLQPQVAQGSWLLGTGIYFDALIVVQDVVDARTDHVQKLTHDVRFCREVVPFLDPVRFD